MRLLLNGKTLKAVEQGTRDRFVCTFKKPGDYAFAVEALQPEGFARDTCHIFAYGPTEEAPLPPGTREGINVHDDGSVTLVMYGSDKQQVPREQVFVIGDFNQWTPRSEHQMKRDGPYFWVTLRGLHPDREYGYQYLVDGRLRLSDAYAEKLLDPWHDGAIPEEVYPHLMAYPTEDTDGYVSVLRIRKPEYAWQHIDFRAPPQENLMIYELHFRDFTSEGTIRAAMKKLDYLESLGVNAIELMPIQEFDGNSSWGYNPNHYFAPDKAYGTPEDYKAFIDACHARGMAVILDMVFNHATVHHPFFKLYGDVPSSRAAPENPWFNTEAPHKAIQFFIDWDHSFAGTQEHFKQVLQHWLKEYRIDGYRLDMSIGFTQRRAKNWGRTARHDPFRIQVLESYFAAAKEIKNDVYFILEHWCENREEKELADKGMMLWSNQTHAFQEAIMGYQPASGFDWLYAQNRGWRDHHAVGYLESHDEERVMYKAAKWGSGPLKHKETQRLRRSGLAAAFCFLLPGPKLIWQFGELGYDVSINHNGRVGEKPVRWEYLNHAPRSDLYETYANLLHLRTRFPRVFSEGKVALDVDEQDWALRRIRIQHKDLSLLLIGNFDTEKTLECTPHFSKLGVWHDYVQGRPLIVQSRQQKIQLGPGTFKVFTDRQVPLPELPEYRWRSGRLYSKTKEAF